MVTVTNYWIILQVHFLSREMVYLGLTMLKYFPASLVDFLMLMLSKLVYGDLTKYGIIRPTEGPFSMKIKCGKYPVVDVGTYNKIKSGKIQVRILSEKMVHILIKSY